MQTAIGILLIAASGQYLFMREKRTPGLVDETNGIEGAEQIEQFSIIPKRPNWMVY